MDDAQRASLRTITLVFGVPVFLFALLGFPVLMFYTSSVNMREITIWSLVSAAIVLVAIIFLLFKLRSKSDESSKSSR